MKYKYLFRRRKVLNYDSNILKENVLITNAHEEVISLLPIELAKNKLKYLFEYHKHSNCTKTPVACLLHDKELKEEAYGVNYVPDVASCHIQVCKNDYSQNPKHRHGICKAMHSEIVAVRNWYGDEVVKDPYYAFVTRYPCEDCLSKLAALGTRVVYYSSLDASGNTNILSDDKKDKLEQQYGIVLICIFLPRDFV